MLTCLHIRMHTAHIHIKPNKKLVTPYLTELWENSECYGLLLIHSPVPILKQILNFATFVEPACSGGLRWNHTC